MEEKFKFENTNNFNMLLITPNIISLFDHNDLNYLENIINLNVYENIIFNSENFIDLLSEKLEISKYNKELELTTQVILEIPNYIYEIIYIKELKDTDDKINEIGNLLNTNGENIYGNLLLMKTYIPSLSDSILIKDTIKEDIQTILNARAYINIVIYDNEWTNKFVKSNNLEEFANIFFEDKYYKCEMPFLLHNINIWYELCDGCSKTLCGKLLERPIYKCIWFTKINEDYKGNLSLNEVNKIIKLSNILEFPFNPTEDMLKDEFDSYKRKIIKNKYKILDKVYNDIL
jgi:hypothetical protein